MEKLKKIFTSIGVMIIWGVLWGLCGLVFAFLTLGEGMTQTSSIISGSIFFLFAIAQIWDSDIWSKNKNSTKYGDK